MRIKLFFVLFCFISLPTLMFGQLKAGKVAINNTGSFTENLDVNGTFRIRRLEGTGANKSFFIYSKSDGNAAQEANQKFTPTNILVTDNQGVIGVSPTVNPPFFYLPAYVMPLRADQVDNVYSKKIGDVFTIDLYKIYTDNFGTGIGGHGEKNATAGEFTIYSANELDYFITYLDDEVFKGANVELSSSGRLTYEVVADYSTKSKTFMNIIFKTKSPF